MMSSEIIVAQNDNEVFEDLKLPSDVEELVRSFSNMSYDVVVLRGGQKIQDSTIEYEYLGKEKVENVEADKISFKVVDKINEDIPSNMLFWFEGTDIKKMEVNGEVIPVQMAGLMGDSLLSAIFSPFYSLSNYDIGELRKLGEVSHSQGEFGGKNINITIIEVENIPEYEIKSGIVKIGEYKETSFVLNYSYVSSEEDLEMKFDVKEIGFHE
jgi:hypothetical protein